MNLGIKILIGSFSVLTLGVSGYLAWDYWRDWYNENSTNPTNIIADYQKLLDDAEALQTMIGDDCKDNKGAMQQIQALENKLADLRQRRQKWLDQVPSLPDINPDSIQMIETPTGRPGSEVPELSSDVPPLPDVEPELIGGENLGRPGSEVPELTPDVPPLPDINDSESDSEYIPEMPELNTGRPGSEVPELTSDVPPLPEIDEMDIINSDEYIFKMDDYEKKISEILTKLKEMCENQEDQEIEPKVISDKCSDACVRYRDCASFTEEVTQADLKDAYDTCMEECPTWPKEMIKCMNSVDIAKPNDCVVFLNCQLPQLYEDRYLPQ